MSADEMGLAAAREYARWHLGHRSWADEILWAYNNPDDAIARLEREKAE